MYGIISGVFEFTENITILQIFRDISVSKMKV